MTERCANCIFFAGVARPEGGLEDTGFCASDDTKAGEPPIGFVARDALACRFHRRAELCRDRARIPPLLESPTLIAGVEYSRIVQIQAGRLGRIQTRLTAGWSGPRAAVTPGRGYLYCRLAGALSNGCWHGRFTISFSGEPSGRSRISWWREDRYPSGGAVIR